MRNLDSQIRLQVSASACILFALMLLVLPLRWLLAAVLAAAVHEACHGVAVRCFGGRICAVQIAAGGARMEATPLNHGAEVICSLAGPVGGLLLLIFAKWIPRVALCGAFQSLWNLLPLYPLDGGNALRNLTKLLLPRDKADLLCRAIEFLCVAALVILGFYGSVVLRLGLIPLLPGVISLMSTKYGKTPCKRGLKRVQ